jgi:transposase
MNLDLSGLSDSQSLSKQQVLLLVNQIVEKHQIQEEKYQAQIDYLEEQNRLLRNELFGRRSEKDVCPDHNQLTLFTPGVEAVEADQDPEPITVSSHQRKKRGRKRLPEHLERVDIVHDLKEHEKMCACGNQLECIGQDECEKLDYIPAKVRVLRHIRLKYACKHCEGVYDDGPTVRIAPVPAQLIPKSNATAGLLAHLFTSKFADGLPLYRQEKIFARMGLELSRSTMANWAIEASQRCRPLIGMLQQEIRSGPLINVDETTFQVLKEPGRRNTSKSYMWVYRGGDPDRPALVYQYHPGRNGQVAVDFIGKDYQGYIQSDAFSGYDRLEKYSGIVQLGCWAHVRRKFVDVIKVKKKIRSNLKNPKSLADEAVDYIRGLYRIEKHARQQELSPEQIVELRQAEARPILDKFKTWLEAKKPIVPPKSLLGKAIDYALSNWPRLIVYIEDGRLKPDNNAAENAIRPFVVGRKNWLFAGNPRGAEASATFFSLIETAKANGLEPYAYLRYLFETLPLIEDGDDYRRLLPQYLDKDLIGRA